MARPQAIPLRRPLRVRQLLTRIGLAVSLLALVLGGALSWLAAATPPAVSTDGGSYREAIVGPIELDPLTARDAPRDPDLTPLLFRGLVEVDERGLPSPDLAERWEVSTDGRVYRFMLRPGLRWDDGQPLTAADVLFTVRRAARADEAAGGPFFWAAVEARAPSPERVEFVLREPLGAFLEHAALPIVAAHAPPDGSTARPAASGPYRLAEAETGVVTLERNPVYHGPPPHLDRLELRPFPSRPAAVQALLDGQVDGLAGLTTAEATALAGSERLVVHRRPEHNKHGLLALNARRGVFRDRAVRQAAAQAIDRESLVETTLDGLGEPAYGPLSPLSWAFDPSLRYRLYGPLAARSLLAEAGWREAEPAGPLRRGDETLAISLLTSDTPLRVREATEVSRQLEAVGFRVETRALPPEVLVRERLEPGQFEAALLGRWLAETDPDQFTLWHSTQAGRFGLNYGGLSSPDLDRWLELGRRQLAPEARVEAYRHFQAVWTEEQPAVLLYHPHTLYALSRDLHGVPTTSVPDASWRLRRLPEWYRQTPRARVLGWPLGG